jgi:hypothetical protein
MWTNEPIMRTAILLDGLPNSVSIRTNQESAYIAFNRGGYVRNFQLQPQLSDQVVLIYRGSQCQLSDKEFETLANTEADPHRRPEAYRDINRGVLSVPVAVKGGMK